MDSYPFLKELKIKLNNLKSTKIFDKFLNLINEKKSQSNKSINKFVKSFNNNQILNYLAKRKYILSTSLIIVSGGLFFLNFLNKNNVVVDNSPLPKVKIDLSVEEKQKEKVDI